MKVTYYKADYTNDPILKLIHEYEQREYDGEGDFTQELNFLWRIKDAKGAECPECKEFRTHEADLISLAGFGFCAICDKRKYDAIEATSEELLTNSYEK